MYVCMYVRMYVCMFKCLYVWSFVRLYLCIYSSMYLCIYVSMYACNVSLISWWHPIVRCFPFLIGCLAVYGGEGSIVRRFFSDPVFFRKKNGSRKMINYLHLFICTPGPFTWECHIHVSMLKSWKCKVSQNNRCLIKPLLKIAPKHVFLTGYPMSDPDPQ